MISVKSRALASYTTNKKKSKNVLFVSWMKNKVVKWTHLFLKMAKHVGTISTFEGLRGRPYMMSRNFGYLFRHDFYYWGHSTVVRKFLPSSPCDRDVIYGRPVRLFVDYLICWLFGYSLIPITNPETKNIIFQTCE